MTTPDEVPGPAVPGGVDANMGPFDEGLTDDPAYRGRTYRSAMIVGALALLIAVIAVVIVLLT